MITNKENWISQAMIKIDDRLAEEFSKEFRVSEFEARKALAEMYYYDTFERHNIDIGEEENSKNTIGYVQY